LLPKGLVDKQDVDLVSHIRTPVINASAFACWDLTPEDLFIVNGVLKYPDPKASLRGIPIIDLACFGGVCRDSYKLKGSTEAYKTIEAFATGEVAHMFDVNTTDARKLFSLGRALQSALTSRFAIDLEKARASASNSKAYLTAIINGE
jgi:hypothetical protein